MERAPHEFIALLLVSFLHHSHVVFSLLVVESGGDIDAVTFISASLLRNLQRIRIELWLELTLLILSLLLCLQLGSRRI